MPIKIRIPLFWGKKSSHQAAILAGWHSYRLFSNWNRFCSEVDIVRAAGSYRDVGSNSVKYQVQAPIKLLA